VSCQDLTFCRNLSVYVTSALPALSYSTNFRHPSLNTLPFGCRGNLAFAWLTLAEITFLFHLFVSHNEVWMVWCLWCRLGTDSLLEIHSWGIDISFPLDFMPLWCGLPPLFLNGQARQRITELSIHHVPWP